MKRLAFTLLLIVAVSLTLLSGEKKQQQTWQVKTRMDDGSYLLEPKEAQLWLKVRPRELPSVVGNGDFMVCRHMVVMETSQESDAIAAVERPALDCGKTYYIESFVLVKK